MKTLRKKYESGVKSALIALTKRKYNFFVFDELILHYQIFLRNLYRRHFFTKIKISLKPLILNVNDLNTN